MGYVKLSGNAKVSITSPDGLETFTIRGESQNQPERSKREDCKCPTLKRYTMSGIYQGEYFKCRCGALNSTVT